MRGLAALYVVMDHASTYGNTFEVVSVPRTPVDVLRFVLQFGHFAVVVFIVLSGYVLMLPVLRTPDLRLPRGFLDFLKRRSRRIIPPYYASLALYILMTYVLARLAAHRYRYEFIFSDWLHATPFTKTNILVHLLLIHNLFPKYAENLNGPTWTVATEFQIYLLFPTVLLVIWRRFGNVAVVAFGTALGLLPHFLLPVRLNIDEWACPWFIGLFAVGMATAVATERASEPTRRPYAWISFAMVMMATLSVVVSYLFLKNLGAILLVVPDLFIGLAASFLIQSCHNSIITGSTAAGRFSPLRILTLRPILNLGAISYSLYLTHLTGLDMTVYALHRLANHRHWMIVAQIVIGTIVSIGLAILFHLVIERRFLSSHLRVAENVKVGIP